MKKLVLYCKSYRNDVLRVKRLTESIRKFNQDQIPFYVSVPASDISLFRQHLDTLPVEIISDEEIIRANPSLNEGKINALPGGISMQIVKSEFWRLGISETYLCIDSDCLFIRPFCQSDFITPDGYPYTVLHETKELLQFAINHGLEKVYDNFHNERSKIMGIFGRVGRHYDFGPTPTIWDCQVWRMLDEQFLKPKGMNFYDAIMLLPPENLWYGEAMLKFMPFPIRPIEPLFKVYHLEQQFLVAHQQGETDEKRLSRNFFGICYQSNWEKGLDLEQRRKSFLSRGARWVKRHVFRRQ